MAGARSFRPPSDVLATTSISGNDHTNRSTSSSIDGVAPTDDRGEPSAARCHSSWSPTFGGRHLEPVPGALEDRLDDGPLLLERMRIGKVQLDLQGGDVHGTSRCGDLALLVGLDDVARLEVLEVGEADAALEAALRTSRASSLNRLSEVIVPFQMTTPSRRKRTFEPRVIAPLRT